MSESGRADGLAAPLNPHDGPNPGHGDAFDTSAERVHETANRVHVGMEHTAAVREAAFALGRFHQEEAAYLVPQARAVVQHLTEKGLIAPAPLRGAQGDAFVVTAWEHTRWVEDHEPAPGEPVLRSSHGADALHAECAICREVVLPARFERVPVHRAEGDGRADQ